MRGEHAGEMLRRDLRRGSSPHARGAQVDGSRYLRIDGIIPACAGSTHAPYSARSACRDHPRMRGEHSCALLLTTFIVGSSPHARGALRRRQNRRFHQGIIPACAGSTWRWLAPTCGARDHPRMRGEHAMEAETQRRTVGSSPHARGAHASEELDDIDNGIIPACAGSTARERPNLRRLRDHPRMRGEHQVMTSSASASPGSSPHARGALVDDAELRDRHGIIPACAGSTRMAR